jgi:hypothetical protein
MYFLRQLAILFLVLPAMLAAQEITFTASVDRNQITVGDQVKLTVTLTNSREAFTAPDLGGMVVVQGPFESSSFNYVNGRMSSTVSRTWVITAMKQGKFTIGPARARIGKAVIETDPITIEVAPGNAPRPDTGVAQGQQRNPNLFIAATLSKNKGYVGEQIILTYSLYSLYGNLQPISYDHPKLSGLWSEDIERPPTGWEDELKVINGISYRVAILKQQLLFPQTSGKLTIDPLGMTCVVNRSFFNRGQELKITSNALEFTALPLPSNAPTDFSGAVGELKLNVEADRTQLQADEAMELKVRITGRSNLKLLDAPKLQLPGDFEVYDPKINDKINVNSNGMSGTREFEYIIIPRHEGSYPIPPVTFSYFDTQAGEYRTLQSDPFTVEVSPGSTSGGAIRSRPNARDVEVLDKDIRYIRTGDLDLRPTGRILFGSAPWIAGMAAPTVALIFFLAWHRRHEKETADVAGMRRKKADRVARNRLQEAAKALSDGKREEFYTAMTRALVGYFADKFNVGTAEVNDDLVRARLEASGLHEVAGQYVRAINECEMARFAPLEARSRQSSYDEAVELIGTIERSLRP